MKSILLASAVLLSFAGAVLAHEGEDHAAAPGSESGGGPVAGPVEVSEVAQRNLGLTLAEAELRSVETTLRVIGEIQADPARSGAVSSRIPGRVSAVYAREGERVEKGQQLVEVESLQLGDPPPRARYGSPVGGVVTDRHVVVGDEVEPNRHLFEVANLSEVLAVGRVFEGQIGQVSIGQRVRVRVPSYPEEFFDGVVERLGGKLDPASRSLAVYVRVINTDGRLRPHMRTTLSLITGGAEFALAIPRRAVLGEAGRLYVFVQDEENDELFERRPLLLGVSNDRFVEVVEGLSPGERVVDEGNYSLQYLTPTEQPGAPPEIDTAPRPETETGPTTRWGLAALVVVGIAVGVLWKRRRARTAAEAR